MSSKPPTSSSSGKDAPQPPPAAPSRPPPKKPKAVPLAEVVVEGVLPVNDAFVAAPVLTESHMYHLDRSVKTSCKHQLAVSSAANANAAKGGDLMISSSVGGLSRPPSAMQGSSSAKLPSGFPTSALLLPQPDPSLSHGVGGTSPHRSSTSPGSAMLPLPGTSATGGGGGGRSPSRDSRGGPVNAFFAKRAERFSLAAEQVTGSSSNIPLLRSANYHAEVAASKSEKIISSLYAPEDACVLRLMAFYKVVHGSSLRVHEELSRNLRVNIADLALVEKTLFEFWETNNDMASLLALAALTTQTRPKAGGSVSSTGSIGGGGTRSGSIGGSIAYFSDSKQRLLPPVSLLVLFLWTCDAQDLQDIFHGDRKAAVEDANKDLQSAAKAQLVNRVRERIQQALVHEAENGGPPSPSAAGGAASQSTNGVDADGGGGAAGKQEKEEDFSRGLRSLSELRLAVQTKRNAYLVNKWAGTLAVLLATLYQVHAVTAPPPVSSNNNQQDPQPKLTSQGSIVSAAGGFGNRGDGSSPPSRPESGRSTKSSIASSDQDASKLALRCRITYTSAAEALAALEAMATTNPEGYPVPLPPMLSFTSSPMIIPPLPTTALRRLDDYVAPSLDVDELGVPRGFEDKIKIQCEGWYVQPKPVTPPEGATPAAAPAAAAAAGKKTENAKKSSAEPQPPAAAAVKKPPTPTGKKKRTPSSVELLPPITPETEPQYLADLPKFITVELLVEHGTDHVFDLKNFCTHHPTDDEYMLPPFVQVRFHSIVPERLKLCLRLINSPPQYPRTDHVPTLAAAFFDRVLLDGRKASAVAAKIQNRLINQFVQPHHCHRHPSQTYVSFCHDCRVFSCAACAKETHSVHRLESISSHCHTVVQQRIQPKIAVLSKRASLLRSLLSGLDAKRLALRAVVDAGIDDVRERIARRRDSLHEDAESRKQMQLRQLESEKALVIAWVEEMRGKLSQLALVRFGRLPPPASITWKALMTHQVLNRLDPRLPTRQVCLLIGVLTWSNPSKYLIHVIYPPEAILASGGGSGHHGDHGDGSDAAGSASQHETSSTRPASAATTSDGAQLLQLQFSQQQGGQKASSFDINVVTSMMDDGTGMAMSLEATQVLVAQRLLELDDMTKPGLGKVEWTMQHIQAKKRAHTEAAFPIMAQLAEQQRLLSLARQNAAQRQKREKALDHIGKLSGSASSKVFM